LTTINSLPFTISDVDRFKTFEFEGRDYRLRLRKNNQSGGYSMDVYQGTSLLFNGVLNYGSPLVDSIVPDLPFNIVPIDPQLLVGSSQAETEITDDNLGVTVKLVTAVIVT